MACVTIAMCCKSCFFDDEWMEEVARRLLLDSIHTPKRSNSKWRRPRASQQCGSDTWCSWELFPVTYKCSVPRGGAVEADTALAVVDLTKKHCDPDALTTALTRPKSATAHWLKKKGVETMGIFLPRFFGSERVEVVARV